MTSKTRKEISRIVDSLIRECNTSECNTVGKMSFAIATHPTFLEFLDATPEMITKIERDETGKITDVAMRIDQTKIFENRIRWCLRNLKDERGFPAFYAFKVNRKTGESTLIPSRDFTFAEFLKAERKTASP